jgi:hypothetical protein
MVWVNILGDGVTPRKFQVQGGMYLCTSAAVSAPEISVDTAPSSGISRPARELSLR